MSKEIMLGGAALAIAKTLKEHIDATQLEVNRLWAQSQKYQAEAVRVQNEGNAKCDAMQDEIRKALHLPKDAHCHVRLSYLKDHGLIFVTTGCEDSHDGAGASGWYN